MYRECLIVKLFNVLFFKSQNIAAEVKDYGKKTVNMTKVIPYKEILEIVMSPASEHN